MLPISVPSLSGSLAICLLITVAPLLGCGPGGDDLDLGDLADDPLLYTERLDYRRAILERDLRDDDNSYVRQRMERYGLADSGWELLPERDPLSRPFTSADRLAWAAGQPITIEAGDAQRLAPAVFPESEQQWIALGERVFFDYPLRIEPIYEALLFVEDGLERSGFQQDGDRWMGLQLFLTDDGDVRLGNTCAQCHSSRGPDGRWSAQLSSRSMDVGAARLLVQGFAPGELPPELDSTPLGDLDRLGPGRVDLLSDSEFNPYAFPDIGGLKDVPFLHHTANWRHRAAVTLAIRCETLFITAGMQQYRIPRVLSYALASYFRSLSPPPPLTSDPGELEADGGRLFGQAGCGGCHTPPLYTSDRLVSVEDVGTDPLAGESPVRATGYYRIPSLRGVGRTAPYLHDGTLPSLEAMFNPGRKVRGHSWGLELDAAEREALVAFLRSI